MFLAPVTDAVVPGYSKVIARPMDFSTMRKRLAEHRYPSFDVFHSEVNLIFNNCIEFNEAGTLYSNFAMTMRKRCDNLIQGLQQDMAEGKAYQVSSLFPSGFVVKGNANTGSNVDHGTDSHGNTKCCAHLVSARGVPRDVPFRV